MVEKESLQNLSELRSSFHEIYHKEIAPIMLKWEKKRKSEFTKFVFLLIIPVVSVLSIVYALMDFISFYWLFFVGLAASIVSCWFLYDMSAAFTRNLKKACLPNVIKAFGEISWQKNSQNLSNAKINDSELFANYNRRSDDDVFVGNYKDVDFSVTETYLWYLSGSGKNKITYSVFKGVMINFTSNKDIKNKTIIATKGDWNIKNRNWAIIISLLMIVPGISSIVWSDFASSDEFWLCITVWALIIGAALLSFLFHRVEKKEKLNEIKLEDTEFNKRYKAYSSDEVEGRYLITTAFMERFKNLQTAFGAKNAKCSFYGDNIMFAISTKKNLFEIGSLFTPLTNPKHMQTFFDEISSVLALIDYFKLDEKTGL